MLKNESMQLQHLNFVGARMTSSPTGYCCSGSQVRKEAWKVRRLVSEFSKAARRPHWPREHAMQVLFRTAGISNWKEADGSFHYLINIYFVIYFKPSLAGLCGKKCSYMHPLKKNYHAHPKVPLRTMKVNVVILPNRARIPKAVVRVKMNTQVRQQ